MARFSLKRGLDLPVSGKPSSFTPTHVNPVDVSQVAVNGYNIVGLKPKLLVAEGDQVKKGQPVFLHKTSPNIVFTAPKAGTIAAIKRGKKRFLENVIIDIDTQKPDDTFNDALPSSPLSHDDIAQMSRDDIASAILKAGFWPALRTRPFSRTPDPDSSPGSLFVTAIDTQPHAPDPRFAIDLYQDDFEAGLIALSHLTPTIHLCLDKGNPIPWHRDLPDTIQQHHFEGPHPSGLVGTHIHFIDPVNASYSVWHIGYQDVIAIGKLFLERTLFTERIISLAGPAALNPRIISVPVGAPIADVAEKETPSSRKVRIVSGSILNGQRLTQQRAFLSPFHNQISLLYDDPPREFIGWLIPSRRKFATARVHTSALFRNKDNYDFSTNVNGSPRAMVPIGLFEEVMPLDILPTQLLRALLVLDTDTAQQLGCLELDEEDLALCTYCCFSKYEYSIALRSTLLKIEQEG
jgi:Na+-transporting NADH:ubiquinone oxidoreductase subunit A